MLDDVNPRSSAGIQAEFFDFRDKTLGFVPLEEVPAQLAAGRFVWIDVDGDLSDPAALLHLLPDDVVRSSGLADIRLATSGGVDAPDGVSSLTRTDRLLHVVLVGSPPTDDEGHELLETLVGEGFLITIHRGPNSVLEGVRRGYVHDFEHHASTPSFLLYEICNKHVESLLATHRRLEHAVERTRLALRHSANEDALDSLGLVSDRLLALRKRVLPVRRVFEELVTRKTRLVSDATSGFIGRMIDTLERLLSDIAVDREILETALHHSLTVMSHRTNQTMNRLAVVSTIFLPLTFLCGIYGMNFQGMPEIEWSHGYNYFWLLSAAITVTLVVVLRRARLL
jgi:Mg2+ and Co2+ transporter CorA